MSAAPDLDRFDPFVDGWGEISHETMRALRRERPAAPTPSGFWYLSRYHDCKRALSEQSSFSNEGGLRGPGIVVPRDQRMINEMDPPDHTRLRRLEQLTLNQANYRALRGYTEDLCRELVAAFAPGETVDLVPTATRPVPSKVSAHLIGVPLEDYEQYSLWSHEVATSRWISENRNERGEGLEGAHPEFAAYIDRLAAERRSAVDPPDDLVTRLALTEIDGDRMSDVEIRITLAHLIIAGNDTTTHLLGNLLGRIVASPELWRALAADRGLIAAAIEESLRVDSVVQLLTRKCRTDVEIAGTKIPAGARVVVGIASANRDETVFGEDADVFRVDREDPEPHLTFGWGPHLCLGANLARMEAECLVAAVLDRFDRGALAGRGYERVGAYWELGPERLEASFG